MPTTIDASVTYSDFTPITVDGDQYKWFDPGVVLQSWYSTNPAMQAICAQYLPPGGLGAFWYDMTELCLGTPNWICFESSNTIPYGITAYLQQFAAVVFAYVECGIPIPCCVGNGGPGSECDADYIQGFVIAENTLPSPQTFNLTAQNIVDGLSDATDTQVAEILAILFPDGVPEAMTCDNISAGIEAGTNECKLGIASNLEVPSLLDITYMAAWLVELVAQLPQPDWCPVVKSVLLAPHPQVETTVEKDPESPETTLKVLAAGACATLALTIGSDLLNSCMCSVYDLVVPTCDPTHPQLVKIPETVFPSLTDPLEDYHQGNAFQVIVNMLSQLMENQGICTVDTTWHPIGDFGEDTTLTPTAPFDAIRLQILTNDNPARIQWQPPEGGLSGGVQRFGKAVWQYADGTQGPVLFYNTNNQVFAVPDPNVVALRLYTNPEVTGIAYYHASNRFPGNTYPLTDAIN